MYGRAKNAKPPGQVDEHLINVLQLRMGSVRSIARRVVISLYRDALRVSGVRGN